MINHLKSLKNSSYKVAIEATFPCLVVEMYNQLLSESSSDLEAYNRDGRPASQEDEEEQETQDVGAGAALHRPPGRRRHLCCLPGYSHTAVSHLGGRSITWPRPAHVGSSYDVLEHCQSLP